MVIEGARVGPVFSQIDHLNETRLHIGTLDDSELALSLRVVNEVVVAEVLDDPPHVAAGGRMNVVDHRLG